MSWNKLCEGYLECKSPGARDVRGTWSAQVWSKDNEGYIRCMGPSTGPGPRFEKRVFSIILYTKTHIFLNSDVQIHVNMHSHGRLGPTIPTMPTIGVKIWQTNRQN